MPAILRGEGDLLRASPEHPGTLIQDRLNTDGLSIEARGARGSEKPRKRLEYKCLRLPCSPARRGMQEVAGFTYGTRQLTRACGFFDIPCKFQTKTTKCVPYTEPHVVRAVCEHRHADCGIGWRSCRDAPRWREGALVGLASMRSARVGLLKDFDRNDYRRKTAPRADTADQRAAGYGHRWLEIDLTHWTIRMMGCIGLVRDSVHPRPVG